MKREEILYDFNKIFKNIFEDDELVISFKTTANDIDDWDSLNHLQLIVSIEKHFQVRFTANEILNFHNVGEMIDSLIHKL